MAHLHKVPREKGFATGIKGGDEAVKDAAVLDFNQRDHVRVEAVHVLSNVCQVLRCACS
jgi:hypothetical protein